MKVFPIISFVLFTALFVVTLVLAHLPDFYHPQIKALLSGSMACFLGMILMILCFKIQYFSLSSQTIGFIILILVSLLAIICQFWLGFYFGGAACVLWLLSIIGIKLENRKSQEASMETILSGESLNKDEQAQNNTCCQKCRCCCYTCCMVTTILLMTLFAGISLGYLIQTVAYPPIGMLVEVYDKETNNILHLHAYCIGEGSSTNPTIFMESGGGSNSIAFYEFAVKMAANQWKTCAYDRLGYGRSSIGYRQFTREQIAGFTHSVVQKMLENDTNKNIIFGGWSAGVEIVQIYTKIYPSRVKGLFFLDGYPDYLTLEAIWSNKTQPFQANTLAILEICRIFEPLGAGFFVGQSTNANETTSKYYAAYYQTGYFWDSQYVDVVNPHTTTQWLTQNAGSSAVPYPNSQIDLNWPDIGVPLLVMPSNGTVSGKDWGKMYLTQCNQYIDKCTSPNKQLKIMGGEHGFVWDNPQQSANAVTAFFDPLF